MHLIFTLLQTTAQKVRHIGSGCSLHKQWGLGLQAQIGQNDVTMQGNFPIAFNTIFLAQVCGYAPSNTTGNVAVIVDEFTNKYLKIIYDQYGTPSRSMSVLWFAIGR